MASRRAKRPPWMGDSRARDSLAARGSRPRMKPGASVWSHKDNYSDEPDSQRVAITVPDSLIDVSNGRLRSTTPNADGTTTYEWFVSNPINNYNVAVNAARYAHFGETYEGERGSLTLDYYPLDLHLDTARKQFQQVKPMMQCFESWFGPFPWYEDGYKLVETPHLGGAPERERVRQCYRNGYSPAIARRNRHGLKWDSSHPRTRTNGGDNITMKCGRQVITSPSHLRGGSLPGCQQGRRRGEYTIGSARSSGTTCDGGVYGVNNEDGRHVRQCANMRSRSSWGR